MSHEVSEFANIDILTFPITYLRQTGLGSGDGELSLPRNIAVAASGNIIVVDEDNNRIQIFGRDGAFLRKFGQCGSRDRWVGWV